MKITSKHIIVLAFLGCATALFILDKNPAGVGVLVAGVFVFCLSCLD